MLEQSELEVVTARTVIRNRLESLWAESVHNSQELAEADAVIAEMVAKKKAIVKRNTEISIECEILESYENGRQFKIVRNVTEEVTITQRDGRKGVDDKLDFESTLTAIFSGSNRRDIGVKELIQQLDMMGWRWSTYNSAYSYISKCEHLEKSGWGTVTLRR